MSLYVMFMIIGLAIDLTTEFGVIEAYAIGV